MAVFEPSAGIDVVKGALSKPVKREGHSHGSYLIGTHREAASQNPNCQRLYIKKKNAYKRSTPLSTDETLIRARFKAVSQAVAVRAKNLTTLSTDQAAFLAQKDSPLGKKTFKAYLWQVCGDAYDTEHPRN